ncbi:hypothetical protein E7V67_014170 [[Empedobacter] haloabium]|uniref:Uncharacterized protein n=1 Tax=[Empedobacter] haloabium TaxID=592317 RepID=A0ABZ1UD94_9BURK
MTRMAPRESRLAGHLFAQALAALARLQTQRGMRVRGPTAAAASPP